MSPQPDAIPVRAGSQPYTVHVREGLLQHAAEIVRPLFSGTRIAVISDTHVAPLYGEHLLTSLQHADYSPSLLTVPAGEHSKSLSVVEDLCNRMIHAGLDRSSLVLALGGGVIGDLAGFTASVFYRGIPFIQIPTTVVAQVDSSVGGKTGVNAAAGKNLIGAFHQPLAVIADPSTLSSLPDREFHEGMAEVIKHAAIRDSAMFDRLATFTRSSPELSQLIRRNVEIKSAIVEEDEFETRDIRALLNFGHTIGHGIENAAGYGTLLHGEAISLGIAAAARLSVAHAGLPAPDCEQILSLLRRFHLPTILPDDISTESIIAALATDKKFKQGCVRFVLIDKIGSAFVSDRITHEHIREAIERLRQP